MKIFVYGTLKKGFYNHSCLGNNCKFLGNKKILGYTLHDTGKGYPAAVETKNKFITGELYDISPTQYKSIKAMELGAGYEEKTKNDIKFFIYPNSRIDKLYHAPAIGEKW